MDFGPAEIHGNLMFELLTGILFNVNGHARCRGADDLVINLYSLFMIITDSLWNSTPCCHNFVKNSHFLPSSH